MTKDKSFSDSNEYCYRYPHPAVTTDCVIFGFDGIRLKVLLIQRGLDPFKGQWAFPGGFLQMDETAEEGAARELHEETGMTGAFIEQLQAFSSVKRDPRERVITIAFYALVKISEVRGGDDAAQARWFDIDNVPSLAFDHDMILRVATARLKEKIHFEPIGFELLPSIFTMTELQNLYEAILGVKFDRRNFYKKIISLRLLIPETPEGERKPRRLIRYSFDADRYAELKQKGFVLEF
jgi:8-oxo-dGTP diphosphatase